MCRLEARRRGRKVKNKELIEYLQGFDPDADVCISVVNITERKKHYTEMVVITNGSAPAIFLNIIGEIGFDEEECRAADEIEAEEETSHEKS